MRGWLLVILLAASTVALTWKAKNIEKAMLGSKEEAALIHQAVPEIRSQSLRGQTVASSEFKGKKKLVVSFWASWCGPCRMELPELKAFYEKYHQADSNFEIVAVSTDDDRYQAEKYAKEAGLPFPVVWDESGKIAEDYQVEAIPVLYVVDENGKAVYGQVGYEFGLETELKSYLGLKNSDAKKAASQ
jgi:cytochrome c biogenesis protein CcmG, thiol:disulfide interchange protein DsbE